MKKYYLRPESEGRYTAFFTINGGTAEYTVPNSYGSRISALLSIEKAREEDSKVKEELLFRKNNPPILIED